MKTRTLMMAAISFAVATPSLASECGMQIQAIERRMHSTGASEVTGKAPSPDAKSQASNADGKAPTPTNATQTATPAKMKSAQVMIDKAKQQDRAGDKTGCEATMMQAQQTMGAVP